MSNYKYYIDGKILFRENGIREDYVSPKYPSWREVGFFEIENGVEIHYSSRPISEEEAKQIAISYGMSEQNFYAN